MLKQGWKLGGGQRWERGHRERTVWESRVKTRGEMGQSFSWIASLVHNYVAYNCTLMKLLPYEKFP